MSDYELAHAYETVNLHRRGGAAKIELNRPDVMNAWNKQLGLDLLDAVQTCSGDDEVRAVMITGAGRGFSSGADLKSFDSDDARLPDGRPDLYRMLNERYHPIIKGIRLMPKPVVAAVHGPAVGIGCSLAICSDLVVAAESAYLLLAFVNIGLVPDGGSSLFIPARAGHARAFEMSLLGERVPAPQALEWGLVNRVWPDDELEANADALLTRLAEGPTRSYAGTKRQLNQRFYSDLDDQLDLEAQIQSEMGCTEDFVEGVMAFVQKRESRFKGS